MIKEYLLYIFVILMVKSVYCQDIIIKNDSTKIKGKIITVGTKEVVYKANKTKTSIPKNELHKLILANGLEIVLNSEKQDITDDQKFKLSFRKKVWINSKVGDYIKISIELGAIINESYCNKPYDDYQKLGSLGNPHDVYFSQPGKRYTNMGGSTGLNFIFGKSPFFKHIIGFNYSNSKGEFDYKEFESYYNTSTRAYNNYEKIVNYKSSVHYLNLINGFRFVIFKKISIDNCLAINIPVYARNMVNGYEMSEEYTYNKRNVDINYFDNKITHDTKVGVVVSFMPKITYEFSDFNKKVGVYFAYNISYKYNLPWWMVGVTYYPFKKLR